MSVYVDVSFRRAQSPGQKKDACVCRRVSIRDPLRCCRPEGLEGGDDVSKKARVRGVLLPLFSFELRPDALTSWLGADRGTALTQCQGEPGRVSERREREARPRSGEGSTQTRAGKRGTGEKVR